MNPLTNVKNITKLNEIELSKGTIDKKSWHDMYKDSAWIFIGGLAYGLTEGDVLAVFSQYGEIVNINLVRDKKTGKTKGFCFLCYANQKSTILAVDNLNGIKLLNRTIRVDHVLNYKPPKDNEHDDEITKHLKSEGCAPKPIKQETSPVHVTSSKKKKSKKEKKKRKKDKKEADEKSLLKKSKIKKEKHDPGYDKYELPPNSESQSSKAKKSINSDSELSTSGESSDENVNPKKHDQESVYDKRVNKTHSRTAANDFTKHHKDDGNYGSNPKRNFRDRESNSDDDYVKQKKSKTFHSEDRNKISSNVHYSKHKSRSGHNSGSSERSSPNDDGGRIGRKVPSSEKCNTSHSSLSKNVQSSESRRKETIRHRHSSSSAEDIEESKQYYDRSRGRDSLKHYRSEDSHFKEYDRSAHWNADQHNDLKNSRDRNDRGHSNDRRNSDYCSDRNNTRDQSDRRMTGVRSNQRSKDQEDQWSKNVGSNSVDNKELSHSRKYSDRNDPKSYHKREGENSNRDSSKYSRSAQNFRSSPTEREEKYSSHRDRDDNRKDWYDRRKK